MDIAAEYSSIFNNKSLIFIIRMINHKIKKDKEQRNWQLYLMNYHKMTKETYRDYLNPFEIKISTRSTEDILKESAEITAKINAGRR